MTTREFMAGFLAADEPTRTRARRLLCLALRRRGYDCVLAPLPANILFAVWLDGVCHLLGTDEAYELSQYPPGLDLAAGLARAESIPWHDWTAVT